MGSESFGDLSIVVHDGDGPVISLTWVGRSDSRDCRPVLTPFLTTIADRAAQARAAIEMHFEALDFFNSSTITVLIQFVQELRRRGIRLVVLFSARQRWQKLSFDALRVFEKTDGLLELRPIG